MRRALIALSIFTASCMTHVSVTGAESGHQETVNSSDVTIGPTRFPHFLAAAEYIFSNCYDRSYNFYDAYNRGEETFRYIECAADHRTSSISADIDIYNENILVESGFFDLFDPGKVNLLENNINYLNADFRLRVDNQCATAFSLSAILSSYYLHRLDVLRGMFSDRATNPNFQPPDFPSDRCRQQMDTIEHIFVLGCDERAVSCRVNSFLMISAAISEANRRTGSRE